jgi:hypothetical protein
VKVSFTHVGDLKRTEKFLTNLVKMDIRKLIETQAQKGVEALSSATPQDSSLAASSWGYEIESTAGSVTITWTNSDIENGYPVAVMIQYGHGTGTGGYVQGIDYINPAMRPIFDQIAETVWKAVKSA